MDRLGQRSAKNWTMNGRREWILEWGTKDCRKKGTDRGIVTVDISGTMRFLNICDFALVS